MFVAKTFNYSIIINKKNALTPKSMPPTSGEGLPAGASLVGALDTSLLSFSFSFSL